MLVGNFGGTVVQKIPVRGSIMKKIIFTFFSVVIAFSFSAVVLAAGNVNTCSSKISRQITLSEEEPAPVPEPSTVAEPAPDPTPEPYFAPDP
jgi:hypothetical protein